MNIFWKILKAGHGERRCSPSKTRSVYKGLYTGEMVLSTGKRESFKLINPHDSESLMSGPEMSEFGAWRHNCVSIGVNNLPHRPPYSPPTIWTHWPAVMADDYPSLLRKQNYIFIGWWLIARCSLARFGADEFGAALRTYRSCSWRRRRTRWTGQRPI